jgi:hypothetical protein
MNIYEIMEIENEIDRIASENDGEIPDEKMKELVTAQTSAVTSVEKLCRYIRHLEQFAGMAKAEKDRISDLQKRAETRLESIKLYLTPFIQQHGKYTAGIFTLTTRKSTSVQLAENFNNQKYCDQKIEWKPDRARIKEALVAGEKINGAILQTKENLQIK